MPMGMADCAGILFREFLRFDPQHPDWHDRDRFVLSAGHGSMLLYALLYLCGVRGVSIDTLKSFRQWNSPAAGHPECHALPAIETTTGPLGQGIATAVGFAIAERKRNAQFGDDLANHRTWVVAGDGCLMEGISQEAIALAGHLNLHKLCILFDDNNITIDGKRSLSDTTDQQQRFQACGWHTLAIDGHDETQIRDALEKARGADKPTLVCCRTHIAFGACKKVNSAEAHGAPLGEEEIAALRKNLQWHEEPFVVPQALLAAWRKLARHAGGEREAWQERFDRLSNERQQQFRERAQRNLAVKEQAAHKGLAPLKRQWLKAQPALASRQSSLKVIEVLAQSLPEHIFGGSADLSGSNGTKPDNLAVFARDNYNGSYIHYGVREHAMAAVMNGIALDGNLLVYGGTFLVFSDYARPAIRLAALMGVPTVFVLTHDSVALGEDGPTHQPVEHLAALRAIPNLFLFRPCDSVEVLECWQAILALDAPSALVLTRQTIPPVRGSEGCVAEENNLSQKGGYIVLPASEQAENAVRLIASGSEVHLAIQAAALLRGKGLDTAVVSLPSWELFEQQSASYREQVLGTNTRIALEAASPFGWERYATSSRHIIAIDRFGASAPGDLLMEKFGFTPQAVADKVEQMLL